MKRILRVLMLLSLITIPTLVQAAISVTFSTTYNRSGCNSVFAVFTPTTTGCSGTVAYQWYYIKNPATSSADTITSSSASWAFTTIGSYNVAVRAVCGTDTAYFVEPNYITVSAPPTIDFTATVPTAPASACPALVKFNNTSTGDTSCSNHSWKWFISRDGSSFSDTSSESSPTFDLTTPGDYTLTLLYTSGCLCFGNITKTAYVHIVPFPTACFTRTDAGNDCNAPVNATFSGSCSSSDVTSYAWTFTGGTPGSSTSVSPSAATTFSGPGDYSVALTVTNAAGCTATATPLNIHVGNLVAYMRPIVPDTVCEGDMIHLEDSTWVDVIPPSFNTFFIYEVSSSTLSLPVPGPIADIAANFGTGLFEVRDVVTNGNGCVAQMSRYIYVRPRPSAVVTVDDADRYRCSPNIDANFHATPAFSTYTYAWTYEAGSTFTGSGSAGANPPVHSYTDNGVYSPTLTVTDQYGCHITVEGTGLVRISTPQINIQTSVGSGCAPISVCFRALAVNPSPSVVPDFYVVLDSVSFGDGSPTVYGLPYGDTFCHDYTGSDSFKVKFYWRTPPPGVAYGNCSGIDSTIVVVSSVLPALNFTTRAIMGPNADTSDYHADSVCPNTTVRFMYTRDPADTSTVITWNIRTSTLSVQPPYSDTDFVDIVYPVPSPPDGFDYTVQACLNGCCVDSTFHMYVFPPPIELNSLNAIKNCSNKNIDTFYCFNTDGAVTYTWDFGDGSGPVTTTANRVWHLYGPGAPARLTVRVTATGPAPGSCPVYDTLDYIRVITDTLFTLSDTAICKGNSINVIGPHQEDTSAYPLYIWNWGDLSPTSSIVSDSLASHAYTTTGVYTVSMTFRSNAGCPYGPVRKRVRVFGPNVNFTVAPNPVCLGDAVTLTDVSTFPNSAIFRRMVDWEYDPSFPNFNSLTPLGTPSHGHTYLTEGIKTIALSDTDASVARCGATQTMTINVVKVKPYFTSDAAGACAGVTVNFHDTNTHCTYTWNFGDGVTMGPSSSLQDVTHIYSANGTYSVTVTVIADGTGGIPAGCQGTYTSVITLTNESGIDISNFADTTSACPPLFLAVGPTITPTSYLYTYTWIVSPPDPLTYSGSYLFTSLTHSGDHLVTLIATSPRGCRDSSFRHYIVGGPTGTLSVSSTSGCAPAAIEVTFTPTGITAPGSNYIWNTCPDGSFTTTTPSITLTYSVPGVYCPPSMFIESGGCAVPFDDLTDSIRIFATPAISVTHAPRICYGASDSLYASGTDTYSWFGPSGVICTGCSFVVVNPSVTTTYTVVGYNAANCSDTELVTVVVDPPLAITISGVDSMCLGETTTLTASGGSGVFLWHAYPTTGPDLGISCAVCNPVTITSTITRTYWAISTNILGCTDSASHTIVINPLPILTYSPNPAYVCDGSSRQITMSGAATYLWEPRIGLSCDSCANPFVTLTNNLIYTVTGTTTFGCRDSITVPVEVYHHNVTGARPDTTICYGDEARLWAQGGISYIWRPGNSLTDSTIYNPIATPTVTTIYTVYIHENPCFDDTQKVKVTVIPTPIISVPPTTIIIAGNSVQLYANALNAVTLTGWAWTPADSTLTCTDCPHPIATPVVTTTYSVTANTIEGCVGSAAVTVRLLCQTDQVFIPNTFTPNGDGVNDRFYVSGKGLGLIKRMAIYNRWGELVYEAYDIRPNDVGPGWDGSFRGEVLPPDVYVYVVDVLCSTGEPFVFRGDISLVR